MLLLILAVLLWGCTDPVDRDIADLIEGGDEAAEARIALNMAKGTAIEPLIAAFVDEAHPVRARAEFAQALYRLYLRTEDERIMTALLAGLEDPEPGVRAAVEARYAGAVVEGPDDVGAGWSDLFLGALQEPRSVRSGAFSLRGPLYRDDRATPGAEVLALPCGDAPLWDANLREVRAAMPEHDFAPPVLRVGPTIDARSRLFRWDEPERRRARAMASVGARGPCVAEHRWGELRLRRYALGGRNQGEAVALVHGDSARWVLETRHAVLGSHVDWLEPTAGWLIGRYESTGPGYLYERKLGMVAIRIADGAAFGIDVEGVYEGDDWQGERWVPSEGLDDSPLPRNPQGMAECLARRVEGRESADPTDADRAECERMLAKDVVIAEGALRVRRPRPEDWAGQPDEWAVIPLRRLTAMARRLSR